MFLCVYQTQNECYLLTNTAAGTSYMQTYSEKHLKEIHSVATFFLSVEEPCLSKIIPYSPISYLTGDKKQEALFPSTQQHVCITSTTLTVNSF